MAQIIVSGASSQVGCALLSQLSSCRDIKILALSRHSAPAWHRPDPAVAWLHPDALSSSLIQQHDQQLLSAGPLELSVELLKQMPHPRRVVALSTASLLTKTGPIDPVEAEQLDRIRDAEQALLEECSQRNIACLILRPTLIWGRGLDRNVMQLASWIRRWPLIPVFAGGHGRRQPLHVDDLAAAMVQAMGTVHQGTWPIAGGEVLRFSAMVSRIATGLGRKVRIVSVPATPGVLLLKMAHLAGRLRGIRPAMLRRQGQDLLVDDIEVRNALGYKPRGFRPKAEELRAPGCDAPGQAG